MYLRSLSSGPTTAAQQGTRSGSRQTAARPYRFEKEATTHDNVEEIDNDNDNEDCGVISFAQPSKDDSREIAPPIFLLNQ